MLFCGGNVDRQSALPAAQKYGLERSGSILLGLFGRVLVKWPTDSPTLFTVVHDQIFHENPTRGLHFQTTGYIPKMDFVSAILSKEQLGPIQ